MLQSTRSVDFLLSEKTKENFDIIIRDYIKDMIDKGGQVDRLFKDLFRPRTRLL